MINLNLIEPHTTSVKNDRNNLNLVETVKLALFLSRVDVNIIDSCVKLNLIVKQWQLWHCWTTSPIEELEGTSATSWHTKILGLLNNLESQHHFF